MDFEVCLADVQPGVSDGSCVGVWMVVIDLVYVSLPPCGCLSVVPGICLLSLSARLSAVCCCIFAPASVVVLLRTQARKTLQLCNTVRRCLSMCFALLVSAIATPKSLFPLYVSSLCLYIYIHI